MHVRIFGAGEDLTKYCNFMRLTMPDLQVIQVDPVRWLPPTSATEKGAVADVHLYVDAPVRLAMPWARFNAAAISIGQDPSGSWEWIHAPGTMDRFVARDALGDRTRCIAALRSLFITAERKARSAALPIPPTAGTPPPKIAVITATASRASWWANMVRNVMEQQWPASHLEWIIVDDEGDDNLADLVAEFKEKTEGMTVRYRSVRPGLSIGAKRNLAVRMASAEVSVFAVMDDDDHYPPSSLGVRASWLLRSEPTEIIYCSTLPMYDIAKYVSAINVPPLTDSPMDRVSEASLLFTRTAWTEKPFPEVSMAEGRGFLEGRVGRSVEIGPAGVIVSFIHGGNTSSRRVPALQEPNGCHYGFSDEFFKYLCEL